MAARLRQKLRTTLGILLLCTAFAALCRFSGTFSSFWLSAIVQPVSRVLSHVSAKASFPLAEAVALVLAAVGLVRVLRALLRCFRSGAASALGNLCADLLRTGALLLAGYILLWYPAYRAAMPKPQSATATQIETLCRNLIDHLNSADLRFSDGGAVLRLAENAVSDCTGQTIAAGTAKFARYPEWMRATGIAGIYSPWTGEVIIRPGAAPSAVGFTACHELMHLLGVADEGSANIAAWKVCHRQGGELSLSADLWALRYAMTALWEADPSAWRSCAEEMSTPLQQTFAQMGGRFPPQKSSPNVLLAAVGLNNSLDSYGALAVWLASETPIE